MSQGDQDMGRATPAAAAGWGSAGGAHRHSAGWRTAGRRYRPSGGWRTVGWRCCLLCLWCLVPAACSQAPQPVTRKAPDQAPPASDRTTPAAAARSSEAERRPGTAPAAATSPAAGVAPAAPATDTSPATGTSPAPAPGTSPASATGTPPAAPAAGVAPATAPPPAVANPPAAATPPAATPPPPPASPPAHVKETAAEGSLVVVDTNDFDPDSQLSLADAAKAEKERKAEAAPPRIVINNKTIHRYAKGGQLTVAEPKKKAGATQPAQSTSPTSGPPQDEAYWRGKVHDLRERWRKAVDRTKELEQEVSEWRRRFYAQDDPYVRDGQIKPAWDRSLDQLRENRAAAIAAKKELADALEEGRAAGALPGWLRDGIELEPKEEKPVEPTQPVDTPIYTPPRR